MILGIALLSLASHLAPDASTPAPASRTAPGVGRCEAAGLALFKRKPLRIAGKVPEPQKTRHVITEYPERTTPTSGDEDWTWTGDLLIDAKGAVRQVFTIQDVKLDPAWPELTNAITAAMLQWRYEPTLRDGKPVPVCMSVSTRAER